MSGVQVSRVVGESPITIETGKVAKLAEASVVVQQGDTVVLVAVTTSTEPTSAGFFPLTCDYRERTYAAGRIPGGFFKREGRPTEKEILTARLMDRPIRPLFPKGFAHEVQVCATVLASDGSYDPSVLAMLGASTALRLSSLPFPDALGVVRVGCVEGQFVVNPTHEQMVESTVDLVVAGTKHGITMMEAGMKDVPEAQLLDAIEFGAGHLETTIALQEELVEQVGKAKTDNWTVLAADEALVDRIRQAIADDLRQVNDPKGKQERHEALSALKTRVLEQFVDEETAPESDVAAAFETVVYKESRKAMVENSIRMDGRKTDQLRQITCETKVLNRTHGSALFTRGETQSLSVVTLGTSKDEQHIESLEGSSYKRFMLHYNFPSWSVGECRPIRGPGRREIGHGALAERALEPIVPSKEEFPYSLRVVSEILESNGSSSMATVCAGSLSLMDAGVPIKAAVSGVAMGLVKEAGKTVILTDIAGLEDHIGDMDFKIAGTRQGATALQMDVKLQEGVSVELVRQIMAQANPARMQILDLMDAAIQQPRTDLSDFAPRITTIKIHPDKIRDVIGQGGKVIRKIVEDTGATIDIEDDGTIAICSTEAESAAKAIETIRLLTSEVEAGQFFDATVKRVTNFGAFCEILPGKEGLVHVSELADKYVKNVEEVVKLGDKVRVKVIEIDQQGRINLSVKQALAEQKEA